MNARNVSLSGKNFTVVSLFAGCGGSSLGYRMAGFKELLAVEFDKNASKCFKINFPEVPIFSEDIKKLSLEKIFEITGLTIGELDILDGSPPCQGFSTSGKRRYSDPRNTLFVEYVRILKGLKPKIFLMENVEGLVKGVMQRTFLKIMQNLRECGYIARAEILNTKYFQVPQSRRRVIIIGVREDIGLSPSFPKPKFKPITVREALTDINIIGKRRMGGKNTKKIAKKAKQGETLKKSHPEGYFFNYRKLCWDKPSTTIIKNGGTLYHPEINASLSIPECKRLQSFPDDFILFGSFAQQWARIGNSVPPLFIKNVALHLKENILEKLKINVRKPEQNL